jgi:hypothetical protein
MLSWGGLLRGERDRSTSTVWVWAHRRNDSIRTSGGEFDELFGGAVVHVIEKDATDAASLAAMLVDSHNIHNPTQRDWDTARFGHESPNGEAQVSVRTLIMK